jgi:DNA-binding beta-propeller fold protein YncE
MSYTTSKLSSFIIFLLFLSESCFAQEVFGNFTQAQGVSLDPQGNIYVADAGANAVKKFDSEGNLVAEIGGYGWGQLEFDQPYAVCATNGLDVFVADYGNHRIQRYNRKLEYIGTLYTRESQNELQRFGYPKGLALNRFGDLYVCDTENKRVLKISGFNRVMISMGGVDAGKGRLVEPLDVEVDLRDNVYVLERNRIVVFDHFGNYVRTLGADTLRAAMGFGIARSPVVVDRGAVLEFTLDGKLTGVTPCSDLASDGGEDCVDIAIDDTRLREPPFGGQARLIVLLRRYALIVPRQD